jgi:hypothetical protein
VNLFGNVIFVEVVVNFGKQKSYIEVDYKELEKFVHEVYPQFSEYSFVANEECGNDSQHSFRVDGKISEYDKQMFENAKWGPANYILLNKLCEDGHISPGEYLIKVSW